MAQITTIIPTYRRPKLLQRAVRSVLNQTYGDFQVCIYDNASDDSTAAVVDELAQNDPRIKYHRHSQNIGLIRNFSYGMKQVTSPFFNLLSDDDVLLPRFFETAIRSFAANSEAMLFIGAFVETDPNARILNVPFRWWPTGLQQPPKLFFQMISTGPHTWTSTLWRKEVFAAVDGLDEEVGLAADLDFGLKAIARFPAFVDNELCAIFIVHPESASETQLSASTFANAMVRMVENIAHDSRVDPLERSRMLAAMNSRFRDITFLRARVAAMRGLTNDALEAARILEQSFHALWRARCIRLLAGQAWPSSLSRAAVRILRVPRRALRAAVNTERYRPYSLVVRDSLGDLGSQS